MTDKKILSIMGVHASYAVSKKNKKNDLVVVKERRDFDDGSSEIALRFYENYQRNFWVTKPSKQNHKSKKEWENIKFLDRYKTTQADMLNKITKVLRSRDYNLRRAARSPYLYGADIDVTTIILHKYIETFGAGTHLPTVGVMDYEWDVDTQSPTIGSYCYENEVYLTVREDMIFKSGFISPSKFVTDLKRRFYSEVQPIYDAYYEANPKVGPKRKFVLNVEVVKLDLDVVRKLFKYTHITQPDYLTFWNGISDLEVIEALCDKYSCPMHTFMNDPSIPEEYRHTKINKGLTETIDANGNAKHKMNSEQWHVLENMASWQFIDIMCTYHTNRAHKNNLPSYAFQYIIPLELGFGKLRLVPEYEQLEEVDIIEWHRKMSNTKFLEYCLYATGDVIGPRILEDKNFEISGQAYPNLTFNPITDFKKNPRLLCNNQHFKCLAKGTVVGTTSDQMREDVDNLIYSADGWIITLNSSYHDTLMTGALSDSSMLTLYIPLDADGDLTSSYPSNSRLLNIARCTTVTELIKVLGIPEETMRELGMDLSSHGGNSIDFCVRMFDMPHLQQLIAEFDAYNASKE